MRILVVEDTKDMNRLIVKALTKAGYSVDGCFDGEEAPIISVAALLATLICVFQLVII